MDNKIPTHVWRLGRHVSLTVITLCLAGCGLCQSIVYGTSNTAKRLFTTQVKTLELDITDIPPRHGESAGSALAVRVYQLRTAKPFEELDRLVLQDHDRESLQGEMLRMHDLTLLPEASVSLSEPMLEQTRYVGILVLQSSDADAATATKMLIPKSRWAKARLIKIDVRHDPLAIDDESLPPAR